MAEKPTVFVDVNIILDVLQKRDLFYEASASVLAAAETGKIIGYVATHTITTLYYLIEKDKSNAEARAAITNLLQFLQVARVDHKTIEQALNLEYKDFEVLQMISLCILMLIFLSQEIQKTIHQHPNCFTARRSP